jgi:hypothetical protein
MENFFNYVTKPLPPEEVEVWFRVNNIIPEKLELYSDFSHSLNDLIVDTYLGETNQPNETKISLSDDDKNKHFEWCWSKVLDNFKKENLNFSKNGDHYDYFNSFFNETFYNQKDEVVRNSIGGFFSELFDLNKPFTKSDLDMIGSIYKVLDKSLKK